MFYILFHLGIRYFCIDDYTINTTACDKLNASRRTATLDLILHFLFFKYSCEFYISACSLHQSLTAIDMNGFTSEEGTFHREQISLGNLRRRM